MKLVSWNVNGLRAVIRKNFLDYLAEEAPDVLCLQETKAGPNEVEQLWPVHYTTYWNVASKKGYAGTAIFTRTRPIAVTCGIGLREHDDEGRVLTAEYGDFYLVNVYVPNSKRELTRLPYRQTWDLAFLRYLKKLELKKPVIFLRRLQRGTYRVGPRQSKGQRWDSRFYAGRTSRVHGVHRSRIH